ncbi:ABC transporter permease [Shewanella colwelliana]|uniref:ABC macrolide family export system permease 2 n=1 Tax=Shewanella colwelliana TaxID=23 RepID=A0ABQ4P9E5_SHECO|nr:ABC transporter permease [Shewanella colwelliana]GIU44151.1 ABC macrolide family export system permease 2 [Shewanella colwelliana]
MFLYYVDLAWRSIKKTPVLSLLMVLAISIGIGITITTLNVYSMMSFNPAGERSDRLNAIQLWSQGVNSWDEYHALVTYQDVMNLRQSDIPKAQAAMFRTGAAVQTDDPDFVPILRGIRVTDSGFFSLFSVPFLYGGAWDKSVDSDPQYQLVIGEKLNQNLFGGENSVGKTVYLNRKPYHVVGVIKEWNPQPKYYDPSNGAFNPAEQLFVPFSLTPIEEFDVWGNSSGWKFEPMTGYQSRLNSEKVWLEFWVDLPSEESRSAYRSFLSHYVEQQKQLNRFTDDKAAADSVQLSNVAKWLEMNNVVPEDNKILVGLSALFLCVCLVNILGLMLTKFLKRAPEVGVRRAIGASRGQIFAQYMVEVGVIGLFGGLLGLLWAWLALYSLSAKFDVADGLTNLSMSMWIITPSIAVGTALLAGLYPAWVVCRTKPSVYLKSQ